MNISTLRKTTLEFTNLYEKKHSEEVEEFIISSCNSSKQEYTFDSNTISAIAGILIYKVLEKRIIGDFANQLPSINKIRLYFIEKRWKNTLRLVLLEYYDNDTTEKYINQFFEIFKKNIIQNYKNEIQLTFFNPSNLIYLFIKIFIFTLPFSVIYSLGIMIKHNSFSQNLNNDKVFNYLMNNSNNFNVIEFHNLYGTLQILIISLILTFLIYLIVSRILASFRVNNIRQKSKLIIPKKLKELYRTFNINNTNILLLSSFGKTPYVSREKNNTPCILIPKKMLEEHKTDRFKFIINHELYHIVNKDYLRNKTILNIIFYLVCFFLLFSVIINFTLKSFGYNDLIIYFYLFILILLIYSFIYSNKLNEFRADFYAYTKTKDPNFSNYFNKNTSFINKIFYPNNKEREKYISNFPKKELSIKTIFILTFIAKGLGFFTLGFFPFFNLINFLIFTSLLFIFIHISRINDLNKLNNKQLIYSYLKWIISVFFLVAFLWLSTLFDNVESYNISEVLFEFLKYILPFLISIPFLLITTKLKKKSITLICVTLIFLIIINDVYFPKSSLIFNHNLRDNNYSNILNVFFVFSLSFIINLIYSITAKKIMPVGNTV